MPKTDYSETCSGMDELLALDDVRDSFKIYGHDWNDRQVLSLVIGSVLGGLSGIKPRGLKIVAVPLYWHGDTQRYRVHIYLTDYLRSSNLIRSRYIWKSYYVTTRGPGRIIASAPAII